MSAKQLLIALLSIAACSAANATLIDFESGPESTSTPFVFEGLQFMSMYGSRSTFSMGF